MIGTDDEHIRLLVAAVHAKFCTVEVTQHSLHCATLRDLLTDHEQMQTAIYAFTKRQRNIETR